MKYHYYPGCSLEGTAHEYDMSTRALMAALDVKLTEIGDWTCCGASAAESVSFLLSLSLAARNIALAEKEEGKNDILVPCSACYINLKRVMETIKKDPDTYAKINTVLAEEKLHLGRGMNVRHLLDVLATDLGPGIIRKKRTHTLCNLSIAPYYGCQCLRPYPEFDNPEAPTSMEPLIEATGASVFNWEMGGRCCGASHMNTKMEVGLELVGSILKAADGADAIATVCPMCQMNLEAYQNKISSMSGKDLHITILYLPQLLGMALEIPEKDLGLKLNLAVTDMFRDKTNREAA